MKEVLSLFTFGIGASCLVVFVIVFKPATRKLRLRTLAACTSLQCQELWTHSDGECRAPVARCRSKKLLIAQPHLHGFGLEKGPTFASSQRGSRACCQATQLGAVPANFEICCV